MCEQTDADTSTGKVLGQGSSHSRWGNCSLWEGMWIAQGHTVSPHQSQIWECSSLHSPCSNSAHFSIYTHLLLPNGKNDDQWRVAQLLTGTRMPRSIEKQSILQPWGKHWASPCLSAPRFPICMRRMISAVFKVSSKQEALSLNLFFSIK